MGNWTTVNIEGSCPKDEVTALREYVNAYQNGDYGGFNCLSNTSGLCGLGDWANECISATGNLAERDYSYEDVADILRIIGQKCPNADIKVHVGGDYESLECVKMVHLFNDAVTIKDPERPTLSPINQAQIVGNLLKAIRK